MERIGRTNSDSSATKLYFRCNDEISRLKREVKSLWNVFVSEYDEDDAMSQMYLQEIALNLGFEDLDTFVMNRGRILFRRFLDIDCKSRMNETLKSMARKAFEKTISLSFVIEKGNLFCNMSSNMRTEITNAIRNHHPNWEQEMMEESYEYPRLFMLENELNENISTSKVRISLTSPHVLFTKNSSIEVQNAVLEEFHISYDDVKKMAMMINLISNYFDNARYAYNVC